MYSVKKTHKNLNQVYMYITSQLLSGILLREVTHK